jgi:hypothetical protein
MKTRTTHPEPVIDEVRAIRHRISARHGHDPRRLVEYYLERQQVGAPPEAKADQESQGTADRDHAE